MALMRETELFLIKRDLDEMLKYYFKGAGALFGTIVAMADAYNLKPELTDKQAQSCELFSKFTSHYSKIPFERLNGKEQFYPLFVVNKMLPVYKSSLDDFFKNPCEEKVKSIEEKSTVILRVGAIYQENLNKKISEMRATPELKDHPISLIDHYGKVWNMSDKI